MDKKLSTELSPKIAFDNSYSKLPERFFERLNPTPVSSPDLIKINNTLAEKLGINKNFLHSPQGLNFLSGNIVLDGSEPIALAYAGQQFGNWVPKLGDGRAHLLGELIDTDGVRRDIQLKGSGPTSFSRSGDGRAWIGPVLREYILSEAMSALNIPTTRALSAVKTGEKVYRDQALPGAVLARVASSHIRVGTFQYFASRKDVKALKILADYVIARHFPQAKETKNAYLSLLNNVIKKQASLIAKWMSVGFIHGVMNTDNVLISGETIDYGPCAFIDSYHPQTVYSSIDRQGRYAYQNQPAITQWNLSSFASSILPLLHDDEATAIHEAESQLNLFKDEYQSEWSRLLTDKIGLSNQLQSDYGLAQDLLERMSQNKADFTRTFRGLCNLSKHYDPLNKKADESVALLFDNPKIFHEWLSMWRDRLQSEAKTDSARQSAMRKVNPIYIPRNHQIERIISAALENDFDPFEKLIKVLKLPFNEQPESMLYQLPPKPDEIVHATFCGT